ncbi:U6 snRNA-associated Sm-like protein LSm2 [Fonsecaea monophora]|uniref:U6 snRNA-associated Sm-like protein LSm2 n=1 Tax=Fonsecaea monophora TaxID=254056 RepID=A0A177FN20_9EURO|nr:U6 snRNA-associated Sm-like protein LSm2 [Fonsecaea monophora]KAH0832746.1 U6 snRNA-associated Sm-like protein LSm2 [Fonsecaea pedrosoi]OAG45713.1 U6 snRNA-associated Sm-like protein LSm2 [Fonsecaea monophora]
MSLPHREWAVVSGRILESRRTQVEFEGAALKYIAGAPTFFFKTLTQQTVTVELKNDISIRGTLKSVDQYLNIKLDDITVLDELKYPHLSSVKNIFIRGSVVRYVHLPPDKVDRGLLEDACRREAMSQKGKGT